MNTFLLSRGLLRNDTHLTQSVEAVPRQLVKAELVYLKSDEEQIVPRPRRLNVFPRTQLSLAVVSDCYLSVHIAIPIYMVARSILRWLLQFECFACYPLAVIAV